MAGGAANEIIESKEKFTAPPSTPRTLSMLYEIARQGYLIVRFSYI
jgi:hypothetical protein